MENTKLIWTYIVAVLGISLSIGLPFGKKYAKESKAWQLFPAIYTFLPALTALGLHVYCVGPLRLDAFGLRLTGHWHYYLAAFLLPWLYMTVNATLQIATHSYQLKQNLRWGELVLTFIVQQIVLIVFIAGEEIGWRGFLQPRLLEAYGTTASIVIMGIVWGLWHLPLALKGYNLPQHPRFEAFVFYPFLCICYSCMLTYLTVQTQSILPAILLHTTNNNLGGMSLLLFDKNNEKKEIGIYFAVGLVILAVSYFFLKDLQ